MSFPTGSPELLRLDPDLGYSPKAACLCEEEDEEYGFVGWNEDVVGLAEVGGVGYPDDEFLKELATAGPLEVDGARVKWLPGPVS